jgi:hypothetical protein
VKVVRFTTPLNLSQASKQFVHDAGQLCFTLAQGTVPAVSTMARQPANMSLVVLTSGITPVSSNFVWLSSVQK